MTTAYSVRLFVEDRSDGSRAALTTLVEKLLVRFAEDGFTRVLTLTAESTRGLGWRERAPKWGREQGVRDLVTAIATELRKADGFVVFHYDGDTAWSRRARCTSREQFDARVRASVRSALQAPSSARPGRPSKAAPPSDEVARQLAKLIECVPHYSLEAWLYHAPRASELCRERYGGRDAERVSSWSGARHEVDEVERIKDETVLGDRHNEELALGVPVEKVLAAETSLAAFRDALFACEDLRPRIERRFLRPVAPGA